MKEKTFFKWVCCFFIMLFSISLLSAQNLTVSGVVTDKQGEPIIGASILVQGTTIGSITDFDGKFSIENVSTSGRLVVSYIGYKSQNLSVSGKTVFKIVLEEDAEVLEEVVVVGYGVQRKSDLTGSVGSVKTSDALKSMPSGNVSDALQGRMAGVSVLSGSGDPSQDNTIRVRGVNSITAETGPLVVIDGFIGGSLQALNPADIASIEVLKDASATAVYGSRGANGVILVTTKNPQKDRLNVSFNAFANFKTVAKNFDTMSPYDFAQLANDYNKEYFGKEDFYNADQIAAFRNGSAGYEYSKEIFRHPALTQNYELSVSGGGEKTTFLASFRYQNDEGILKESQSSVYNWRLKVDTDIKKWLKVGVNFYGDYRKSSGPYNSPYEGLLLQVIQFPNTVDPMDENGDYNNKTLDLNPMYNPMAHIWESNNSNQNINNNLQGYVQFNILDGLTFRSQLGVTFNNKMVNSVSGEKSRDVFKGGKTNAYSQSYWNMSWINSNTLNYVKEFNKNHRINATAVFEQSYGNNYNHKGIANNLDRPELGWDALGWSVANLSGVSSDRIITTMMSGMLRLNYVLMNKYMITASLRADGSSRLDEKWSYFPSAALAWDIKQEDFLKNNNLISQLKLRLGYGSVGNQSVEAYRIYSKMVPVRNPDGTTSYKVDRPVAPYLQWERNDQVNVGVDFGMFNGRLTVNADWYSKKSKDILMEVAQPTHMGYGSLLKNAGQIKNTGVEFTISTDPVVGKNFSWHTDLTLSHNKGIFEKIPTPDKMQIQAGGYQNDIFRQIEGEKLGTFWGYTFDGIWQESDVNAPFIDADGNETGKTNGEVYKVKPGNVKLLDVNKDGIYNEDDKGIIGCGQPTFNWGWSNTFNFRNFDLSLYMVGFHGFDIYNSTLDMALGGGSTLVPLEILKDRWTKDNTNTNIPGFVNGGTKTTGANSFYVENGSFVKVKSITLGYTLPMNICKNIGITNLRIYASVQNPFTFTKYSGLDPESTLGNPLIQGVDWGSYPNSRNYLVGLNFSF